EGLEAVAHQRRALVLERLRRDLQSRSQPLRQALVAPAQHRERPLDVLGVRVGVDLPDARRRATPDLVVEARTLALEELAIAARAQRVERPQERDRAPHRLRARE